LRVINWQAFFRGRRMVDLWRKSESFSGLLWAFSIPPKKPMKMVFLLFSASQRRPPNQTAKGRIPVA